MPGARAGRGGLLLFVVSLIALGGAVALSAGWIDVSGSTDAELAAREARIAELERALEDARAGDGDGDNARIIADRDRLAEELAALRHSAGQDIAALEAEIESLRGSEIPRLQGIVDQRDATIADLEARLAAARDAAGRLQGEDRLLADIDALEADLARRDDMLAQLDAEIARLTERERELRAAAEASGGEIEALRAQTENLGSLQTELEEVRAERDAARAEIATLQQQLEAVAERGKEAEENTAPEANQATRSARTTAPRDPLSVADALSRAKGLDEMSDAQRDRVATALIEGQCVADALALAFARVPLVAMRDMIALLESDC